MGRFIARVSAVLFCVSCGFISGCGSSAGNQVSYDNSSTGSKGALMESRVHTAYDDRGCAMVEGVMR